MIMVYDFIVLFVMSEFDHLVSDASSLDSLEQWLSN